MPNIITHILFTDDVYEKLDDPKYDFLESRLQLMEVGGNGPDFLFFHNLNPTSFMKKTPLRKIGNEVHSHSINDFYASAVASIQKEKDPEKTLYILIDTHNAKLLDQPWMFTYFKHQMVLDHHIKMVDALIGSEYTYINSRLSSMAEFVSLYLQYVDEKVAPIVGTIMLAGMEIDTNSYNIKTTAQTYEVAAYLMRMGANNIDKQNLLQESMEVYKRRQDFIKTSYMINENMALCTLNDEIFEKGDLAQIAEELLQFDHVEAAFAIGKIGPTEIGISARSVGTINVQKMMVQLGGGGHKSDAAAQIPHATINQIKEKLLEIVN